MKIVVIVYAVSWLILLIVYVISLFENKKSKKKDDALEKFINKHKSAKDKIMDKLVYVIMIVFAPLVVLVLPYIVIKHIKSKREARIREEEREKSEKEYERHKKECLGSYYRWSNGKSNCCGNDYINLAQSLIGLVRKQNYDDFLTLLDKTSLPSSMKLGVKECERHGSGDRSRLFVSTPGNACDFDIFKYLNFEKKPMGAWQAYLISRLGDSLPMWWHANYGKRDYIYSKEDIGKITHFIDRKFDASVLLNYDVAPKLYGENERYYVSCCYWTDFGGLKREFVEIQLLGNQLYQTFVFDEKTIHEYQCGIMF